MTTNLFVCLSNRSKVFYAMYMCNLERLSVCLPAYRPACLSLFLSVKATTPHISLISSARPNTSLFQIVFLCPNHPFRNLITSITRGRDNWCHGYSPSSLLECYIDQHLFWNALLNR